MAGSRKAEKPLLMFWRNGGIGDRLLILPTIQAIQSVFGDALVIPTDSFNHAVLLNGLRDAAIHEIVGDDLSPIRACVANCDAIISVNSWISPELAELIAGSGVAWSAGFFEPFLSRIRLDYDEHPLDMFFRIARAVNDQLCLEDHVTPLFDARYSEVAERVRDSLPSGARMLVIHGDTKPYKMWPPNRLLAVIEYIMDTYEEWCVFIVGQADLGLDRVSERHRHRVISAIGGSLAAQFCLVARADMFIGIDSCFLHVADLFGVKGIGLFGPTQAKRWGFRVSQHCHIQGEGSTDAISPELVIDAFTMMRAGVPVAYRGRPNRCEVSIGGRVRRDGQTPKLPAREGEKEWT